MLDLTTGAFTRTGINWTQVGWYGADIAVDSLLVGTAYIYAQGHGGQGGGR